MKKTIETTVYTYDELSETAKQKALQWMLEGSYDDDSWDYVKKDAEMVGLKLSSLDHDRGNEGEFRGTALETAEKILTNHGSTSRTHKTAEQYITHLKEAIALTQEDDAPQAAYDALSEVEEEFLGSLLEDYRLMLESDYEYRQSREYLEEGILANEYTFTEDGQRFG